MMTIDELKTYLEPRLDGIIDKITTLEQKLTENEVRMDSRLANVNSSLEKQGSRIGEIEKQVIVMESARTTLLDNVEKRIERIEDKGKQHKELFFSIVAILIALVSAVSKFL